MLKAARNWADKSCAIRLFGLYAGWFGNITGLTLAICVLVLCSIIHYTQQLQYVCIYVSFHLAVSADSFPIWCITFHVNHAAVFSVVYPGINAHSSWCLTIWQLPFSVNMVLLFPFYLVCNCWLNLVALHVAAFVLFSFIAFNFVCVLDYSYKFYDCCLSFFMCLRLYSWSCMSIDIIGGFV